MATTWLMTNHHADAVNCIEMAAEQTARQAADPHAWKWVVIALHGAVQGVMVLALWRGNGLLTMKNADAKKWLDAYYSGGAFASPKLDHFLGLYDKVKEPDNFSMIGAEAFPGAATHDASMRGLNDLRNDLVHMAISSHDIEIRMLAQICLKASDVIDHLLNGSAIAWHSDTLKTRAERALADLRVQLQTLGLDPMPEQVA